MTFSLCQLCGTIIRFIFYKCDLLPNLTHLELQTAEFGQNLAKRAKIFVFGLMVFSFYHLLGHHIRFHLVRITFSSDSYCDLQHISKVLLFQTLTHYLVFSYSKWIIELYLSLGTMFLLINLKLFYFLLHWMPNVD